MRHRRRNPAPTLSEELDALAAHVELLDEDDRYDFDVRGKARPILTRHLGRPVGPSSDWVNTTWHIDGDLYLFEDDYDSYEVLRRSDEDSDEPDAIEEVKHLPDFDALRRYFRARQRMVP